MSPFKNREGEIRSGWKILIALVFSFIVAFTLSLVTELTLLAIGVPVEDIISLYQESLFGVSLGQLAVLIGVFWAYKTLYKDSFKNIGLHLESKTLHQFIFGLAFGAASISLVYLILRITGHINVTSNGFTFSRDIITGLIIFILVGFSEEILFRGYIMTALDQMKKTWITIGLSSLIFALAHLGNPNLSVLGIINIGFIGALFAMMYIKTRSLWMPIGYHITWNYFQGNVLGLPVSGLDITGIISSEVVKEDILSGGSFGPEGGLVSSFVIALGFIVLYKFSPHSKR